MAGNFTFQEYKASGFLSGLFGNPKVKKAITDINNLLANANSIFDLNSQIIDEIIKNNDLKSIDQIRPAMYDFYYLHLLYCYKDNSIDTSDREELQHIIELFGLERSICNEKANNIINDFIKILYNVKIVSPEQDQTLRKMVEDLETGYKLSSLNSNDIERFKTYWNLDNGIMRNIPCDLLLANDEQCYLMMGAELYEFTTITKKIKHKGHGIGFSVLPGVSIGFGGGKSKVVTKDIMKKIETGNFYVTNKKIVFKGKRKSNAFKLDDVVDIEVNNKGVVIVDTNGYNPTYEIHGDKKELELVIRYVINNYNQQT